MKEKVFPKSAFTVIMCCFLAITWVQFVKADTVNIGKVKGELRDYFRNLTENRLFSGSVLVAKDGKILYKEGLGIADYNTGQVNTIPTVYPIASMSKAFTAMSIMILEERELLNVDDNLSIYLPDFLTGDQVTIRQLLNMTAGVHGFEFNPAVWENLSRYHDHDGMLSYFMYEDLDHEPGTQWSYCNSCYYLLGLVIQEVSGMTYRDFIRENILCPLGMKHTGYDPEGLEFPQLTAVGYDHIQTDPPPESVYLHPTITFSAGAIYSTVSDMYKWGESFKGETLVSAETIERIFTPGLGNYGFGWYIEELEVAGQEKEIIWHWGSYVGYHGFIARFVDDDIFVMLLLNFSAPNSDDQYQLYPFARDAAEIVLNDMN